MTSPTTALIPGQDMELVPEGWWESTLLPWAQEQTDVTNLKKADAGLAGMAEAYRKLGRPTIEFTKGRRTLELQIGEALGPLPGKAHGQTAPGKSASHAGEAFHRMEKRRFRQLAAHREAVLAILRKATAEDEVTRAAVLKAITGAHVGQNTGESEWFTPAEIADAARAVMGGIDLDPASTPEANAVIKAKRFYTADDDGLAKTWRGRVWMNPPYGQPLIALFIDKLVESFRDGVPQACVLVNNATETDWFQTAARCASALCFRRGRVRFWHPERKSATPLQGQAILYLGTRRDAFCELFGESGFVMVKP